MRITVALGPLCLSFRRSLDLATCRQDPIGMSGTDYGTLRIAECLRDIGHSVVLRTVSAEAGTTWNGIEVIGPDAAVPACDAMIAINEPDLLRDAPAGAFRVCMTWLNDFSFARAGLSEHVDLFASCSAPHLEQFRTNPAWHRVQVTPDHPDGAETFRFDESKWAVIPLGCDPERLGPRGSGGEGMSLEREKVPGRVVYCSSPDRGLHWLLQEWPAIKAAVPHAELRVFYRLKDWLRSWDNTPHFPAIEPLRKRALYIEEALRRLQGHGVTVRDSVSRDVIEEEMSVAEVLGYPCETTTWSEGFSCTILECCAAQACPVITDCDALGEVYAAIAPVPMHLATERWMSASGLAGATPEWVGVWRERVIRALTDEAFRADVNAKARKLAEGLTWKRTAERLVAEIERRKT